MMPSKLYNIDLIISNLEEAQVQIRDIIRELDTGKLKLSNKAARYSEQRFKYSLEHAYHHLNFAWHIRNISNTNRVIEFSDEDFEAWSKYPINDIREYK